MPGIEPIPKEERNLGGWDFFLLWAGAAISLAEIWAGSLMVPLGLGLGLWAIGFAIYLGFSPMLMEKVLGIKAAFPWPIGSSLPSMVLAGFIYWFLRKRR